MPEIEFVEVDPPALAEPAPEPPLVLDRLTAVRLIPALLALGAAALATWAPFSWIYALIQRSDTITFTSTDPGGSHRGSSVQSGVDGWGRIHSNDIGGTQFGHDPRDGIVLVTCAVLLVLGAASLGAAAIWRNTQHAGRLTRFGRSIAIAAAAGSAAMSWAFYLDYDALRSQLQKASQPGGGQILVSLGHAWLIAASAALLALLAIVASHVVARLGTNRHDVPINVSQPPPNLPAYIPPITSVGEAL